MAFDRRALAFGFAVFAAAIGPAPTLADGPSATKTAKGTVHVRESKDVDARGEWKAGAARATITPKKPVWLAGYAARNRPADGALHDLWVKALAIEDAAGWRGVLVTADLCGFSREMCDDLYAALRREHGLDRMQVVFAASHTHSGPVVRGSLLDCYPLDDKQLAAIEEYTRELERTVVATVGKALASMAPATLSAGEGTATFAVNRRNNREADVVHLREKGEIQGPSDHSVPVLAVRSREGGLTAVVFGYACHATVLDTYVWCGDYPGFAQIAVEKAHPGTQAMFWDGCGADQNPLPRRSVELCEKYGTILARGVEDVLRGPMRPLKPILEAGYQCIELRYEKSPTATELESAAKQDGPAGRWARRMLGRLRAGEVFETSYPYTVQAWRLGGDQLWVFLNGEVVVDYAIRLKKALGHRVWVTAYTGDLMGYIPSRRVLREGGYEATRLDLFGHPAHSWESEVEEKVVDAVRGLAGLLSGSAAGS